MILKLFLNAPLDPGRKADVVQKDADEQDREKQEQDGNTAPFERGKENPPAPAAAGFRDGFLHFSHADPPIKPSRTKHRSEEIADKFEPKPRLHFEDPRLAL